ncbi:hypothetical protein A3K73_01150 [Candidatus Pacearchaeota archaeon RBG_13_36_9]|nr:MAG: hypothetical protein A3K73_01150 [Candidatus Pacearchaeota archaeon RBG_13_36_9]
MGKKRVWLFLCVFLAVFLILTNILLGLMEPRFYIKTAGKAIDTPKIGISGKIIEVQSPENITYSLGDKYHYLISLDVSANFEVKDWKYDLIDARHENTINKNALFTPGKEIEVSRWENKLIVHAFDEQGEVANKTVEFFVASPDSFPLINYLNSTIYICEGDSLGYNFTVSDPEEASNNGPIETRIEPLALFYILPWQKWLLNGQKNATFQIFSEKLTKENAGGVDNGFATYNRIIQVNDGRYSSLNKTVIRVIEINNAPEIHRIGVKTEVMKWKGENALSYSANVFDREDGNQDSGNLKFTIDFGEEDLFGISPNGVMEFVFNENNFGIYNITVCASDTGIENPDLNIKEVCGQTGGDQTSCTNFSLTIAKTNNPPTITDFYPKDLELEASSESKFYFNITMFDPEKTAPDVYWYVDEKEVEYYSGIDSIGGFAQLVYTFGCGADSHSVKARITDGLANDTIEWKVKVNSIKCEKSQEECSEKWFCENWKVCQNLKKTLGAGILSDADYRTIQDGCAANKWPEENCGFQIRGCSDISSCNTSFIMPEKLQRCYYTENPNCEDGIKNCHSRDCEFLTDCGGPCKPCPTCYDGMQNQGEEGVDCGGPCYVLCENEEKPIVKARAPLSYFLTALVIILFVIIGLKIAKISRLRKEIEMEVS